MSDAERSAQSEIIVTGHVDAVTDWGLSELKRPSDGKVLAILHNYSAGIRIGSVEKGDLKAGEIVNVGYHQTAEGPPGPQGQNELPRVQSEVRVFLRTVGGSNSYELLQPNGWEPLGSQ